LVGQKQVEIAGKCSHFPFAATARDKKLKDVNEHSICAKIPFAMRAIEEAEGPKARARLRARRLRFVGVLILLVGLAAASSLYWLGTRAPDFSNDPSMIGFDRPARRQIAILYGAFGEFAQYLTDYLKRPGVQASIIVFVSAGAAFGCFSYARFLEYEEECPQTPTQPP
jgi:hypothetical protein